LSPGLARARVACGLAYVATRRCGRRLAVTGYDPAGWGDLFLCAGGAAAALAGLIFVGLSVNMSTLLELDKRRGQNFLTGRALEAFVALLSVLVICIVALTPHIVRGVLAALIVVTAAGSAVSPVRAAQSANREERHSPTLLQRVIFAFALTCCLLVCGITLAAGHGGGLFWLPAAFAMAIVVASVNSWVLLVEVLR
jgi:hypothetical protein